MIVASLSRGYRPAGCPHEAAWLPWAGRRIPADLNQVRVTTGYTERASVARLRSHRMWERTSAATCPVPSLAGMSPEEVRPHAGAWQHTASLKQIGNLPRNIPLWKQCHPTQVRHVRRPGTGAAAEGVSVLKELDGHYRHT